MSDRIELEWQDSEYGKVAYLGDFEGGDGVRFYREFRGTCYRRGPHYLLVEVAPGPMHEAWGCFDHQDQPARYYHLAQSLLNEANALATVLHRDRYKEGR